METAQIYSIPQTYRERHSLRNLIAETVERESLFPPLSMEELSGFSDRLIRDNKLDPCCKGWIMVEVNNSVWKETVASIPYEKRILLLPKCLSNSKNCTAEIDEIGLLCHRCMSCSIVNLEDKAEELGMMSMVAEGFTSVIGLIQNQVIDTVIGVGCLDSLEKAFPLLIDHAVPGMAIPLNGSGCKDTHVDLSYVERTMGLRSEKDAQLLDYEWLKSEITTLFRQENLAKVLSNGDDQTTVVARDWMDGDGKRWRPYLLAATYMALTGNREIPEEVGKAAIAVECFHKASLVHDDIQDNDTMRYGKQTVNAAYGVPVAINVGDILLGEGYNILTECGNMDLVREAAAAHIALCKGQGMELEWSLAPHPLTMDTVLDIFCNKTVPAFDVSLIMGVICAGRDQLLEAALHIYSKGLGIAYQLQDDIEDFETEAPVALRPSAVLAAICEQQPDSILMDGLLACKDIREYLSRPEHKPYLDKALERVREMAEQSHREAIEALKGIRNVELKRLLFRVTKKILK